MTGPVVCLVQARMGSQRFPGKMMEDLAGAPVMSWVLRRLGRAKTIDRVVLATTVEAEDDVLAGLAESLGIDTFRGDAHDVLDRFAAAARSFKAATVVRVCADNPLVAPEVVDAAVAAFLDQGPDYAFNHVPRHGCEYPDGLGAEVVQGDLLQHMARVSTDPIEREHVTTYIWNRIDDHDILVVPCPDEWKTDGDPICLDVDRPEDIARMRLLCRGLDVHASAVDIIDRWRNQNDIDAIAVGS